MAYPWPGFGTMVFRRTEQAILGTDVGWVRAPTYARSRPLGSSRDDIVALAVGSDTRSFEANLDPDRYAALAGLVNSTAIFVDWERPVPGQRSAALLSVTPVDKNLSPRCLNADGVHRKIRVKVELVSQD